MAKGKNDTAILQLKKEILEKRKALSTISKFSPVTNCSIIVDKERYNIQTVSKEVAMHLLVLLNSYRVSAEELGLSENYKISGFTTKDWIIDLKDKLIDINRKIEDIKLKAMEKRLHELLSTDKKAELEIKEIMESI